MCTGMAMELVNYVKPLIVRVGRICNVLLFDINFYS